MRGQNLLFNNLLQPETLPQEKNSDKGRSKELISKRDTRLLYRYYYYAQIHRKQYGDIITLLSDQFDLSEMRVIVCLSDKHLDLKRIFTEKPSLKFLKDAYPWLSWVENNNPERIKNAG
jgi:hypothetical protein